LAAGNQTCFYSSDGITWTTTGFKPTPVIYALSWNGTYWIAGGSVSTTSMYYNTSATASVAWTNSTNMAWASRDEPSPSTARKWGSPALGSVATGPNRGMSPRVDPMLFALVPMRHRLGSPVGFR
jgi:hypothetical protein